MPKSLPEMTRLAVTEKKELAARGEKLISRVRKMRREMAETGHEMGRLLKPLKEKAMIHALGFQSFEALCNVGLHISSEFANQLVAIAEHFTAKQASELGNGKATALIGLAHELKGEHTPGGLLVHRSLDVGHGKRLDVKAASADQLRLAARELRGRSPRARTGGIYVSKEDTAFVARVLKALRNQGVDDARVAAIAGAQASGGKMRIDVTIKDALALSRALSDAHKGS